MCDSNRVTIRKGTKEDCPQVFELYQELVVSEKMEPDQMIDEEVFTKEGFGEKPCFEILVVENLELDETVKIIGFALYFEHYAMVSGRTVFMECLYIRPNYQKKGLGTKLWKEVVKAGLEKGCSRCMFMAFGWNEKALEFYYKCGAVNWTIEKSEHCLHMPKDAMLKFVNA